MERKEYDHEILLLQGGGALGAYQAGVYEGLVEAGVAPTWVVGISIGAINASLIVGNPPSGGSSDCVSSGSESHEMLGLPCRHGSTHFDQPSTTWPRCQPPRSAYEPSSRPECHRLRSPRTAPKAPSVCTTRLRSRPRCGGFRFDQFRAGPPVVGCESALEP